MNNSFFPTGYVSTRPHPTDIEAQYDPRYEQGDQQPRRQHSHAQQRKPATRSSSKQAPSSTSRHHTQYNVQNHCQRESHSQSGQGRAYGCSQSQTRGRTKNKRHSAGSNESRARFSESSSSRTRVSGNRESGRTTDRGYDANSGASQRTGYYSSRAGTRQSTSQHFQQCYPPPSPPPPQLPASSSTPSTSSTTTAAAPATSRRGIASYFKSPSFYVFGSQGSLHGNESSGRQERRNRPSDRHRLSWKVSEGDREARKLGRDTNTQHFQNSSKAHHSRKASQEPRQQHPQQEQSRSRIRKTGYPGKNGEEPATDPFQFLDIMMDMPLNPNWKQIIFKLCTGLAALTISYFALMALYFSAEFQKTSYLSNLNVLVVDLDHSMIGTNFLDFTQKDNLNGAQINWSIQSYKDLSSVIKDVENGNYWGAMVVQSNASSTLNKALSLPLKDYDPTKAFMFIYDGGRDPLTVKPYIVASMYTQFLQFTKFFNPAWVKFVLQFAAENNATLTPLVDAPHVLGTPVAFEEMDLHPPTATIITSATTVAYIWIFLVAGGSTYLVTHVVQPLTRHATVRKTMVLVLVPLLVFLGTLSMTYSVLLRIFGVPFDSTSQFLSVFGAMFLLQAAVAAMVLFLIFLIPVVFIPSFTITFVVMNVIAVFNPVELMPSFYRWVYAMPFLNAVQMARFVLMGSYERLEYNLPILFAWIVVPVTLLPFAIARQKRLMLEVHELERQQYKRELDSYHHRQRQYYLQYFQDQQDYYKVGDEKNEYETKKSHDSSSTKEWPKSTRKRRMRQGENEHNRVDRSNSDSDEASEGYGSDRDSIQSRAESDHVQGRFPRGYGGESDITSGSASDIPAQATTVLAHRRSFQVQTKTGSSSSNHRHLHDPTVPRPSRHMRALSAGMHDLLANAAAPSAPPEEQVFDLANNHRAIGGDVLTSGGTGSSSSSTGLFRERALTDRTFIEMPKLSRHPYASELMPGTRQKTPDEVK
ncbi:hypothetical protein BG004_005243 [Podila humilis]|nr:hypothetical protein BG004_005243 [Podila humilis]